MAPVKKKSKTDAAASGDSTVELGPLTQASNSTKRNLEQPMASDAKRFKRSDASSDISHLTASTGKQPKAMHTIASATESKFHYLGNLSLSDDDEQFPSMPFVKPSKSSSTKTTSQQAKEYVAKVKEAADQEFDKWKQQQEVQITSKAAPLAASVASNSCDNSEDSSHPITDKTSHHSSADKSSSPTKEQARSALQFTLSQSSSDFINLDSDSDDQNEASNNDQVPGKSTASTTHSGNLSATTDDDKMHEVASTSSTLAVTTPIRKSLVNGNNTMLYKSRFFLALKDNQLFCRLLVNNKKSPKYCKQCPYSVSSSDPLLLIRARDHIRKYHKLRASDVKGNQYVQVINTDTGPLRVTIDFTVSTTHSAPSDNLKPTQSLTLKASPTKPIATSSPTLTATTTTRPSLVEEKEKETFQYKCQSFFIKRGDHFFCRLVNQDGHTCNGKVAASPDLDPTSLMMSHLQDAHHINYLDVKDKEEYISSYDLEIRRVIIDFNEPLLEEIMPNAGAAVRHQQQQATSASTTQAVTPIRTRPSLVPVADTFAYKSQHFFVPNALQHDRFRCRLINEHGYACFRKKTGIILGPSHKPIAGMTSHLSICHKIFSKDLINKDKYVHKSASGKIIKIINLTGPLLETDPNFTNTDELPLTGNSTTRPSLIAERSDNMTFKCQYFFAPIEDQPEKYKCLLKVGINCKPCKLLEECKNANNPPTYVLKSHLQQVHWLKASDIVGKLEYVHKSPSGEIIRTFKLTGPLPGPEPEQDPSTLTAEEVDYFNRIFSITRPQPLNHSLSADKELTIYSMFHHSLLYLVASPEYLQSVQHEIEQIDSKIQAQAEAAFYQEPTNRQLCIDAFRPNHTIYLHLNKTEFAHPLELLNNTFYAGMTNDFKRRQGDHLQRARTKYFASSYQAVSTQAPKLYEFIADGWKNENAFYMNEMFHKKKLKSSAIFYEHLIINGLISSPLCKNTKTGVDNQFEEVVEHLKNISKDTLAMYGMAELVAYYQKPNLKKCRPFDVLSFPGLRFIREVNFLDEANNRRNAVKQPATTAYSLANHAAIPNFSLVDGSGEFKNIFRYAIYLFTSIFTIPPKLAFWYLWHEGSIDRLNQVDNDDHRQDYLMSMSAIIISHPTNLADCIKWARQLFTLLFDTNVRLANVPRAALNLPELHPISINDENILNRRQIDNFLIITALLRARLYNLKGENGNEPSLETMENALSLYLNASEPEVLFSDRFTKDKPYRKITHFTELADVCSPPSSKDLIQFEDPQFDPEYLRRHLSITPIEPYMDDDLVLNFVLQIFRLRHFSFYGLFSLDRNIAAFRHAQFSTPYFRLASLFPQFL